MRNVPVILLIALTLYALFDCARTQDSEMKSMPKPLWLVLIVIAPLLGPVAWLVAGRVREDEPVRYDRQRGAAPDDNPAFLRKLDDDEWSRRRRQERDSRKQEPPTEV